MVLTHHGVGSALEQLFHGDGGGGAADAGTGNSHRNTVQRTGPRTVFPVEGNLLGVVEILGDLLCALRAAGEKNISAHVTGADREV